MTKIGKFFLILGLFLAFLPARGQGVRYTISPKNAETVLKQERIKESVDFLCSPATGGRASGTPGAQKVARWLEDQFRDFGLKPLSGSWLHGFQLGGGAFGRNVMGLIPGTATPAHYVIVMAHYDNLGTLDGTFYPGADSNASGVAALIEVARMMRHMQDCKKHYRASLLIVALDGKEKDLAGASELWRQLEGGKLLDPATGEAVRPEAIDLVINLDQLGGTEAPITKGNPNFLIMLSEEDTGRRSQLESANHTQNIGLELGYDYYGSKDFTTLFFRRISDQKPFLEHGVPAVMFTSGITLRNNKPTDTPQSLDYPLMRKRIQLIFYYLDKIL